MISLEAVKVISLGLLIADGVMAFSFVLFLFLRKQKKKRKEEMKNLILNWLSGSGFPEIWNPSRSEKFLFLECYVELCQSIRLTGSQRESLIRFFETFRSDLVLIRQLQSRRSLIRQRAIVYLSYFPTAQSSRALVWALENETRETLILLLVNALIEHGVSSAFPSMIDVLPRCSGRFQRKIIRLLAAWGDVPAAYFHVLKQRNEEEIRYLLMELARNYPHEEYGQYLLDQLARSEGALRRKAFKVLVRSYPRLIDPALFLTDEDPQMVVLAIEGVGRLKGVDAIPQLVELLGDPRFQTGAEEALDNIVSRHPSAFHQLMDRWLEIDDEMVSESLLRVLAVKMEYYLGQFRYSHDRRWEELLPAFYRAGLVTGIINFLNQNTDRDLSNRILHILKPLLEENQVARREFAEYLNPRDLSNLSLEPLVRVQEPRRVKEEPSKAVFLIPILVSSFLLVPLIFLGVHFPECISVSFWTLRSLKEFLSFFTYLFGFYALVLNLSYIGLLLLSVQGVNRQYWLSRLKGQDFLLKPGILPTVTLVAPAYNEESSIIESIQSLMSLHYPRFEVVVVNDGSSDHTLERCVSYFQLERRRIVPRGGLKTKGVRGVYTNPRYPSLIVIDKWNGGKADSLNCGINFARGDYFAAIDSDSLLEPQALLNLTSAFLDYSHEVVATGGNIFPVNGCVVRRGHLLSKKIPSSFLPRIQTIEYIRAFMGGRVGWAVLKTLLVISGAFGLFNRERVLEIRGYLTGQERLQKDTVGEDMELVVRLKRQMLETKHPGEILYQFNANCWTEVPGDWKTFKGQRDRWQRGLIDIIHYHRKMLGNPRYGRVGLLGFPYYLIFEIFGPWLELQGYVVFAIALVLGWLSPGLFLFLFSTTVLLGIALSLGSLILAEKEIQHFSLGDKLKLLLTSIIENLGVRQYISLLRVKGFISALRKVGGWGKMARSGFSGGRKEEK